jgi:phosphoribosylglycinamide formyltransferase-1
MTKKRVAILASGSGSNLQVLLDAMAAPDYPAEPVLVFSNKAGALALERGRARGVRSVFVNPAAYDSKDGYDARLLELLKEVGAELICLAGYMRILTPRLVQAFHGRILNIHPSLLPKFGGPGMYGQRVHEAVLAAGEKVSGATVHIVDEGVDSGTILLQGQVEVRPGDDVKSLAARVLEQEHRIYPQALRKVCESI